MTNEEIMKLAHAAGCEQGSQFDDCGDCSRFDVVKFARMVAEVGCKRVDAEQQASSYMADAYAGAREDIEIWKKRALEAKELNRKFIAGINGQTYMGEPAASPTAGMTLGERILHVGGRENANGYIEFGSVMAVGALIKQVLRDTRPQPAQQPLTGGERAVERDEMLQVALNFIETLTGMQPPPIEIAPPEVFAPFRDFVDRIQAVADRRSSPPPKQKPLTDEQIDAMWQQSCREHFSGLQREIHLARAIEHAHGIK